MIARYFMHFRMSKMGSLMRYMIVSSDSLIPINGTGTVRPNTILRLEVPIKRSIC